MESKITTPSPYYELFEFFNQEHDLILADGEMSDIIHAVNEFQKKDAAQFKAAQCADLPIGGYSFEQVADLLWKYGNECAAKGQDGHALEPFHVWLSKHPESQQSQPYRNNLKEAIENSGLTDKDFEGFEEHPQQSSLTAEEIAEMDKHEETDLLKCEIQGYKQVLKELKAARKLAIEFLYQNAKQGKG